MVLVRETRGFGVESTDPGLLPSPGCAARHGFKDFRRGTLSLYAAFNTERDEVPGKAATRHTAAEFVAFLADVVAQPAQGHKQPKTVR